jgi:hypothetical protein
MPSSFFLQDAKNTTPQATSRNSVRNFFVIETNVQISNVNISKLTKQGSIYLLLLLAALPLLFLLLPHLGGLYGKL